MNTADLSPVDFHGQTLFLVEHNAQPFTPMKPIVEGMGLDWSSQLAKFNSYRERWGMAMIAIPSLGGDQDTVCMPLRKLPAWLLGINPSKVRPAIRKKVIMYQRECDDALWDYWTKGQAVNPRAETPAISTQLPQQVGVIPMDADLRFHTCYDNDKRIDARDRYHIFKLIKKIRVVLNEAGWQAKSHSLCNFVAGRFCLSSLDDLSKSDLPIVIQYLKDMLFVLHGSDGSEEFPWCKEVEGLTSQTLPAVHQADQALTPSIPTLPAPEIPQTDGLSPSEHAHMVIQAQLDSLDKVFYAVDDYLYEARRTINAEADKLADGVPCRDKPARRALASELKTSFGTHTHAVLSDINAVRSVLRLTATAAGMILPKKGRGYPRKLALTA